MAWSKKDSAFLNFDLTGSYFSPSTQKRIKNALAKKGISTPALQITAERWVNQFYQLSGNLSSAIDTVVGQMSAQKPVAETNRQLQYSWDVSNAKVARGKDFKQRLNEVRKFTEPNMVGFFPPYDPSFSHSNFSYGYGDTETADDNRQIIEIAGVKVVWNKTLRRWEQPESGGIDNQFYRVYNPQDASYVQTEDVHGKNKGILAAIRKKLKAGYSESWNAGEDKAYNDWLGKSTVEGGHNWVSADASWKLGLATGDFARYREPEWKRGLLDSLHLSTAIFGRGKPGESKNALQNLAKHFNISAESLGIPAHASWADTVLGLKVVEKILQTYPDHPASKEFIAAMDSGNVHSHYWESNPDYLHGSSFLTHNISGRALSQSAVLQNLSTAEAAAALEIDVKDLAEGRVKLSDYEEMSMTSSNDDLKSLVDYIKKVGGGSANEPPIQGTSWNGFVLRSSVDAIKTAMLEKGLRGEGWNKPEEVWRLLRDEGLEGDVTAALRMSGFPSNNAFASTDSLGFRMTQRAMAALEYSRQKDIQKIGRQQQYRLDRDYAQYADMPFYQALEGADRADATAVEAYDKGVRAYERQQKQQLREAEKQRKQEEKAAARQQALEEKARRAQEEAEQQYADRLDMARYNAAVEESKWRQKYYTDKDTEAEKIKQKEDKALYDTWEKRSKDLGETDQSRYHNAFSTVLEEQIKKRDRLEGVADTELSRGQRKELALLGENVTQSFEDYANTVSKVIERNKQVTRTFEVMYSRSGRIASPIEIDRAMQGAWSQVSSAAGHFMPTRQLRFATSTFSQAGSQFMEAMIAPKTYGWSMAQSLGNALTGAAMAAPLPPQAKAGMAAAGFVANIGSQALVGKFKTDITQASSLLAGQLNLLASSFQLLLAPLNAFRSGLHLFRNLWGHLTNILGIRYGIPYSNLTGIGSTEYHRMLDSDSVFGFKPGTINNMHNQFAFGQAGLFTSGQFDTNRLVAAARLGVFDTVYAPMGGDTQKQFATTVDRLYARMKNADPAERQSMLYLANQLDPNMVQILERMDKFRRAGYSIGGFEDFQKGNFTGMWIRHPSDNENTSWEYAASQLDVGRHSFNMEMKRIAVPLWNKFGKPLVDLVNSTLDRVPGLIGTDGINWAELKKIGKEFWKGFADIIGIDSEKGPTELFHDAVDWVKKKLEENNLGQMLWKYIEKGFVWIGERLVELTDMFLPTINRMIEYIRGLDFGLTFDFDKKTLGFNISSAPERAAEAVKNNPEWARLKSYLPLAYEPIYDAEGNWTGSVDRKRAMYDDINTHPWLKEYSNDETWRSVRRELADAGMNLLKDSDFNAGWSLQDRYVIGTALKNYKQENKRDKLMATDVLQLREQLRLSGYPIDSLIDDAVKSTNVANVQKWFGLTGDSIREVNKGADKSTEIKLTINDATKEHSATVEGQGGLSTLIDAGSSGTINIGGR